MDTAAYAGLREGGLSDEEADEEAQEEDRPASSPVAETSQPPSPSFEPPVSRFKVEIGENAIMISAILRDPADVEKLVRILNANKEMLLN